MLHWHFVEFVSLLLFSFPSLSCWTAVAWCFSIVRMMPSLILLDKMGLPNRFIRGSNSSECPSFWTTPTASIVSYYPIDYTSSLCLRTRPPLDTGALGPSSIASSICQAQSYSGALSLPHLPPTQMMIFSNAHPIGHTKTMTRRTDAAGGWV